MSKRQGAKYSQCDRLYRDVELERAACEAHEAASVGDGSFRKDDERLGTGTYHFHLGHMLPHGHSNTCSSTPRLQLRMTSAWTKSMSWSWHPDRTDGHVRERPQQPAVGPVRFAQCNGDTTTTQQPEKKCIKLSKVVRN
eukprot:scaffold276030_cov35-Tisochrysis_lutea.AAC.2